MLVLPLTLHAIILCRADMATFALLACYNLSLFLVIRAVYLSIQRYRALSHIPTIGYSSWVGSFFSFFRHLVYAQEYFDQCYYKV